MRTWGLKSRSPSESHRALEGQDWRASQSVPSGRPLALAGGSFLCCGHPRGEVRGPGFTTRNREQEGKPHRVLLLTPHSLYLLGLRAFFGTLQGASGLPLEW